MADTTSTTTTQTTNVLEQGGDQTAAIMTKTIISILTGPKLSALLAHWGVTLDPILASTAIVGGLHKLHLFIKQETNWTWL